MNERELMGSAMKRCRDTIGFSLPELARLSGVTEHTIRNWESGRTVPALDAVLLVSQALGVGVDVYIGNAPMNQGEGMRYAKWIEVVCFARDPEAADMVLPVVYQCSRCGRLQYEKTKTCLCGSSMNGSDVKLA